MGGGTGRHICRPYWMLEVIPLKIGMFSLPGIGPTRAAGPTFKNCNIETRYRLNRSHLPVGAGSKPAQRTTFRPSIGADGLVSRLGRRWALATGKHRPHRPLPFGSLFRVSCRRRRLRECPCPLPSTGTPKNPPNNRKKALGTVYARFQHLFSLFHLWQGVFL